MNEQADEQSAEALDVFNAFAGSRHRANKAVMGWSPGTDPMLPPWSSEVRERVRSELKRSPLVEVRLDVTPDEMREHLTRLGQYVRGEIAELHPMRRKLCDPQPTILGEERRARVANISRYCRKCRGLGTKRHHAMCPLRGLRQKRPTWGGEGMTPVERREWTISKNTRYGSNA